MNMINPKLHEALYMALNFGKPEVIIFKGKRTVVYPDGNVKIGDSDPVHISTIEDKPYTAQSDRPEQTL